MKPPSFSWKARFKSFQYAAEGFWYLIRQEHNFRLHLVATAVALFIGFYFRISKTEWLFILFAIGGVLSTEAMNTAVEKLADTISPEYHPMIKIAKDVAAFAVLLMAIVSVVIGCLIFLPKILGL